MKEEHPAFGLHEDTYTSASLDAGDPHHSLMAGPQVLEGPGGPLGRASSPGEVIPG